MPNYSQYPTPYVPYQYQQYPMQMPMQSQQSQPQPNQQNTPQLQSAGFILIPTEEDAYRYPVAFGKCMTFKVENEPIVIEKSMSYSQLENPKIDRYRLVREDVVDVPKPIETVEIEHSNDYDIKDEIQAIRRDLEGIKKKLETSNQKPIAKKREEKDDE